MNKSKQSIRFVLITILTFIPWNSYAQNEPEIQIRIHYISRFFSYEGQKAKESDETILDICNNKASRFYSCSSVRREEIKDSVFARGGNMGDVMNAWDKAGYPRTRLNYQVWKNYPAPGTLTYTDKLLKFFRYSEPITKPEWALLPQDSIIAGCRCQQAETFYFGRHWKVWFTLEIPVHEGPWKLHGLPGLILSAQDSEGLFSFECIQIENIANQRLIFPDKKYLQCTKEEYHELIRLHWKSPEAFAQRMTGFKGSVTDAKGKPLSYPERNVLLLEK